MGRVIPFEERAVANLRARLGADAPDLAPLGRTLDEMALALGASTQVSPANGSAAPVGIAAPQQGDGAVAVQPVLPDELSSREQVLAAHHKANERPLPVNVDGAIAAVCGDLGLDAQVGDALFIISRLPGIIAHALEEWDRQPRMRQIDPKDHLYDGAAQRRLPETRK